MALTRRKLVVLVTLLPAAIALHVYLVWLGGGWRIFAIVEACVGIFLAGAVHDAKKLDRQSAQKHDVNK